MTAYAEFPRFSGHHTQPDRVPSNSMGLTCPSMRKRLPRARSPAFEEVS